MKMIVYSGVLQIIFISVLLNTVRCQLSIVSANTVSFGEPFTVTCEASRVPVTENNITKLVIYRKMAADTNFNIVTSYEYSYNFGETSAATSPGGRNWNFTFAGGKNEGKYNRDTMKIKFTIFDTTCSDSGLYQCEVTYYLNGGGQTKEVKATDQNVTIVSVMRNVVLKAEPKNAKPTEEMTITCMADGNQNLQLFWKSMISNKTETDISSGITPEAPFLVNGSDCVEYRHRSVLKMAAANITESTMFTCVGKYMGQEVGRKSFYIDKFGASSQQSILSTYTATLGGIFSAICDASRVPITENDVDFITELAIHRTASDGLYPEVARYTSTTTGPVISKLVTPRDWTVTGVGHNNSVDNMDTMKLEFLVKDVMCVDAGIYTCWVKYSYNNGTEKRVNATDQKLTVISTARNLVFKADPNSTTTLPRYGEYNLKEEITFTCSVDGMQSLKFEWKSQINDTIENVVTSGNTSADPVLISNSSCVEYRHSTTLKVTNVNKIKYICVVSTSLGEEVGRDYFTINLRTGSGTVPGPDDVLLVSIVIGLLAYIVGSN